MSQLRGPPDILEEASRRGPLVSQPDDQCADPLGGRPTSLLGRQARVWGPGFGAEDREWEPRPVLSEEWICADSKGSACRSPG